MTEREQQYQGLYRLFQDYPFLEKIPIFLEKKTPLNEVKLFCRQQEEKDIKSLFLALYCYCRTPDNFRLSILQASQLNCSITTTITGTLSGTYNGFLGIPVNWRLALTQQADYDLWCQQINQLWAKWTGVEDEQKMLTSPFHKTKSQIRLISQQGGDR